MTVLIHDAHANTEHQRWSQMSNILGDTELLYADDTLLVSSDKISMESLLHEIERQSARYGMKLDRKICELIRVNNKQQVHSENKEKIKTTISATYLGANINITGYRQELEGRLQKSNAVFTRLRTFWRDANTELKWKLLV